MSGEKKTIYAIPELKVVQIKFETGFMIGSINSDNSVLVDIPTEEENGGDYTLDL